MNLIKIWIHVTVMSVQGNHVHLTCFKRPCLGQAIFPIQQHGPSAWVLVWFHLQASPGKIIYIYIYNKKIIRNQLPLNKDFFYQKIKIIIRISIFLTYLLHLSHTIVFTHLVYNSVLLKKVFLG